MAAAEIFAMTQAPFEETALKFVQMEDRNGLRTFLEKKLDQLEPMVRFFLLGFNSPVLRLTSTSGVAGGGL